MTDESGNQNELENLIPAEDSPHFIEYLLAFTLVVIIILMMIAISVPIISNVAYSFDSSF